MFRPKLSLFQALNFYYIFPSSFFFNFKSLKRASFRSKHIAQLDIETLLSNKDTVILMLMILIIS